MRITKKALLADALLLITALIWGSGFVVMKDSLDSFPPSAIIAMRFTIATAISAVLFRRHLRGLTRADVLRGGVIGVALGAAYVVQTIGLSMTTAGKNAFLTTVYVLLVPFACRLFFGAKLHRGNYIAAALMVTGIGLLSLDEASGGMNKGDWLTLLCGVLYAAQIIAVDRSQRKSNAYALIVLQFAFAAMFAAAYWLLFERDAQLVFSLRSVGGLLYVAIFSTTVAMSLQNIGQSMAPASHAAILMSLESVFGAMFSCLLLGEVLTIKMAAGFAVIFAALVVNSRAPREEK